MSTGVVAGNLELPTEGISTSSLPVPVYQCIFSGMFSASPVGEGGEGQWGWTGVDKARVDRDGFGRGVAQSMDVLSSWVLVASFLPSFRSTLLSQSARPDKIPIDHNLLVRLT